MTDFRAIVRRSANTEVGLAELHAAGASPVEAIKALCDGRGLSLRDAKAALMESPSWHKEAAAANAMWEELTIEPTGTFEVTNHFELKDRGAYIVGHIHDGVVKIGDTIAWPHHDSGLTVIGIECLDNISEKKFWNALIFRERPTKPELEQAFPVGALIDVFPGDRDSSL